MRQRITLIALIFSLGFNVFQFVRMRMASPIYEIIMADVAQQDVEEFNRSDLVDRSNVQCLVSYTPDGFLMMIRADSEAKEKDAKKIAVDFFERRAGLNAERQP